MKKILTLTILYLIGHSCPAQQKVFELPVNAADADGMQVYQDYDPNSGSVFVTLASHFKVQRFSIAGGDTSFLAPHMLAAPLVCDAATRAGSILPYDLFLGHSIVGGGIEECYADRAFSKLTFIRTRFQDNVLTRTDSILIPQTQHLFAFFHQDNDLYALAVVKDSDTITIYHHRPDSKTEVFSKQVAVKDWGKIGRNKGLFEKKRIRNLADLVDQLGVIVRDPYTPPLLLATLTKTKLYITPGKVYLTFDNTELETRIVELPLSNDPARILQFDAQPYYHKPAPPGFSNGNSFIIDSTLIVASIIHLKLYLAFFDLSTGRLKAAYEPQADGSLTFMHTPVWQVGDLWRKDALHAIRLGEFAKNSFDYWTFGISGHKYGDGRIQLRIGTAYNRETFGNMLLAVAAMGTYSAMSVAAGQPGTLLYAGTAGGRKNTMFLVSQFQSGSCTTLPFKELEDKSELIDSFADSHKISRKDLSIAGFKGSYWLGYYDAGEQKYSIYKF